MKRIIVSLAIVLTGIMFIASTQLLAQKKQPATAVLQTAADLKWQVLSPSVPGVMSVKLWGDSVTGAYGGLTKFPAGFKAPLHHHTYTTNIVVIKGAYTYNGRTYGPGSFVSVPGGLEHESGGMADSESVFFIEQPGTFDLVPATPPKQ